MNGVKKMAAMATMMMATVAMAADKKVAQPSVEIPFEFQVGKSILPAGAYNVRLFGTAVVLTDAEGQSVSVLSHGVESRDTRENTSLEFVKTSGVHQLYRFWQAGHGNGQELSLASGEKKMVEAAKEKTRIVVGD